MRVSAFNGYFFGLILVIEFNREIISVSLFGTKLREALYVMQSAGNFAVLVDFRIFRYEIRNGFFCCYSESRL